MRRPCFPIRTSRFSIGVALFLTALWLAALGHTASAQGRPYEAISRYPVAVRPVAGSFLAAARVSALRVPAPVVAPRERVDGSATLVPGSLQESQVIPPGTGRSPRAVPPTPAPDLQFDAVADDNSVPPDSAIAAGPAHLVCAGNAALVIRKLDGTFISQTDFGSFFSQDTSSLRFDPRVVYDATSGRFIFTCLGRTDTANRDSVLCLAVSKSSDPTGAWNQYVLHVGRGGSPPTEWGDFDCLGYDQQALYVSTNMFTFASGTATGTRLLIIDKAAAEAGSAVQPKVVDNLFLPSPPFVANALAFVVRPVEAVSATSQGLLVTSAGLAGLALYRITDPLGATVITPSFIDTTDFELPGAVSQSGSGIQLDTGDTRLLKVVLRDGVIWTCHAEATVADGQAHCVFFRIDAQTGALLSADTISDASLDLFFPSIFPDSQGNAIAVFSGCSATTDAGIYYARYDGTAHAFAPKALLAIGSSPYTKLLGAEEPNVARWGDYTDACVDVKSGTGIWIQGELAADTTHWVLHAARVPSASLTPPAAPDHFTAGFVLPGEIDLSWKDESSNETGFEIDRSTDGGTNYSLLTTTGSNVQAFADKALPTGITRFFYRIRAVSNTGNSAFVIVGPVTRPAPPTPPSRLTLQALSGGSIQLTWVNTDSTVTGLQVERKIDGGAFASLLPALAPAATTYTDAGLTGPHTYTYHVEATNAGGSADSQDASLKLPAPPTSAPTGLVVSPAGSSLRVKWSSSARNVTDFRIERQDPGGSFAEIESVKAGVTAYTDASVSAGVTYAYRVRAAGLGGFSSYSRSVPARAPGPPAAPVSLSAVAKTPHRIKLTWGPGDATAKGFLLERKTDTTAFAQIVSLPATARAFVDRRRAPSTHYTYRIRAFNALGNSPYSPTADATTPRG